MLRVTNLFNLLLGLLPGAFNTINGITNAIANAKIAALTATTDQARIAAQEQIATLEAKRAVLIADGQRSSLDIWIRSSMGISVAYIIGKLLVYDKTFDATTIMSQDLWQLIWIVTGFYFLHSIIRGR